jgi:hypothetical protein
VTSPFSIVRWIYTDRPAQCSEDHANCRLPPLQSARDVENFPDEVKPGDLAGPKLMMVIQELKAETG